MPMTDEQGGRPPTLRTFHIPELRTLRQLREMTGIHGDGSTPEDSARRATHLITCEVLRFLGELKRRIERGERCRVVEVERAFEAGMLSFKFKIMKEEAP
jgi:hypothetical protein